MTTKLPKSNIDIYADLVIRIGNKENPIFADKKIEIKLDGLKQSKSGVYEIVHKLTGKRYIGMTRDLERRKWRHCNDLILGNHSSRELQIAFNIAHMNALMEFKVRPSKETFEADFEFNVIIYCRPSELTFYEHLLIKYLNPEFNVHKQKEIHYEVENEPYGAFLAD